jgi:hypothetical protein
MQNSGKSPLTGSDKTSGKKTDPSNKIEESKDVNVKTTPGIIVNKDPRA